MPKTTDKIMLEISPFDAFVNRLSKTLLGVVGMPHAASERYVKIERTIEVFKALGVKEDQAKNVILKIYKESFEPERVIQIYKQILMKGSIDKYETLSLMELYPSMYHKLTKTRKLSYDRFIEINSLTQ